LRSFKEYHNSINKGDESYINSLEKAKVDSHGDKKMFTKLAAGFTGKSKIGLKSCLEFNEILKRLVDF